MRKCVLFVGLLLVGAVAHGQQSVVDTAHNLSVSGPGTIRAASETQVCIFCHTPHNSTTQAPLWNRADPGGTYQMYWSPTMNAYPSAGSAPQPNGSTKLCLSCHDGTIALGATVASGTIPMSGGITTMPTGSGGYLGTDLSGHHPVSFQVTTAIVAENNASGDVPLKSVTEMRSNPIAFLDAEDRVQCASCHDPHQDPFGGFLRSPNEDDTCLACHS
jgi:predicted CXXCH cytochrome family protein